MVKGKRSCLFYGARWRSLSSLKTSLKRPCNVIRNSMMLAKVRHQYFLFVTTCVNRLRILSHDFIRHILRHKLSINNNNNNNSNNNNNYYYYYYYYYYYNDDNYSGSKYAADERILSKELYSFKFNSDISNGELKTLSKGSSPAIFQ